MLKPIITTHKHPLLENFQQLDSPKPESYSGFVYMWHCIPEDMYYIGSHKGVKHDEYRGSGKRFSQVLEYYGITKFERVILEYVGDEEQIKHREQFWLDRFNAVKSKVFYNMKNVYSKGK